MKSDKIFSNAVCVITGAASGIGFALAEALAQHGARIFMSDIDEIRLKESAEKLAHFNSEIRVLKTDVTDEKQVGYLIDSAISQFGRIDFAFNNAGVGATKPFMEMTMPEWRRVIDLDFLSVVYGVRAELSAMLKQKSGHIVNTSSLAGVVPLPFQSAYCAVKFAVRGLTESLRYEFAESGIRFSTVCPGNVSTPIFGTTIDGARYDIAPPSDAISPLQAAKYILDGVDRNLPTILFPESSETLFKNYQFGNAEKFLFDTAKERAQAYKEKGRYY